MSHRPSSDDAVDLRVYAEVLRRRWRLVGTVVVVFLAVAVLYSFTTPVTYTGEAQVLVDPGQTSSGLRPDQLVSIDTEAQLAASASIATIANRELGWNAGIAELLEHVAVETTPDSLVLDISFSAPTPRAAAEGANAFAEAYLSYRQDRAESSLNEDREALQQKMDELAMRRDAENEAMNAAPDGSVEFRNARSRRDILNGQIQVLALQLTQIPVSVDPGEVILPATPPTDPSSPKHPINLALGLFLGLFVGMVAAFVWDRTDDRIRARSELEVALGAPTLAIIPRALTPRRAVVLVTDQQPKSPAAEAYRTLRTNVMALARTRDLRVIGVTGAAIGEGKTTTVANLSVALAEADQNVLAISADLRRPMLHRYFAIPEEPGLSEVLAQVSLLEGVMTKVRGNLYVIASGVVPSRPAELLQSRGMAELVRWAREAFDFIVVDLPPVPGIADTLVVAPLLDGLLVVAQAEKTRQAAIRHAVSQLAQVGAAVDGGVMNSVVLSRLSEFRYGYGYGYGYERSKRASSRRETETSADSGTEGGPTGRRSPTEASAADVSAGIDESASRRAPDASANGGRRIDERQAAVDLHRSKRRDWGTYPGRRASGK